MRPPVTPRADGAVTPSSPLPWPVPYSVRESARARHARLRVRPESGLEVVLPRGMSRALIPELLERHRVWIQRTLRAVCGEAGQAVVSGLPEVLSLHGGRVALPLRWGAAVRGAVLREGELLLPEGPDNLASGCRRLREWVRGHARETLDRTLRELAAAHGFRVRGVRVRLQKSRWGSCTASGDISLNLCLVFLPDELCRHVLLHELTHTCHCNHGPGFWKALFVAEPDALALDKRLRRAWMHVPGWIWLASH